MKTGFGDKMRCRPPIAAVKSSRAAVGSFARKIKAGWRHQAKLLRSKVGAESGSAVLWIFFFHLIQWCADFIQRGLHWRIVLVGLETLNYL